MLADADMMERITELFHKHDGEDDYWSVLNFAIERGVSDVIDARMAKHKTPCKHFKGIDECHCNNDPYEPGECVYDEGIEPAKPSAQCKYYEERKG